MERRKALGRAVAPGGAAPMFPRRQSGVELSGAPDSNDHLPRPAAYRAGRSIAVLALAAAMRADVLARAGRSRPRLIAWVRVPGLSRGRLTFLHNRILSYAAPAAFNVPLRP